MPTDAAPRSPLTSRSGVALIEMAFVLPVLILCFFGMVEICQWLMTAERVTKTANQLAAILYSVNTNDLQGGGDPNAIVAEAIRQAQSLGRPLRSPTIVVRYCRRDSSDPTKVKEIYKAYTTPPLSACTGEPDCNATASLQNGYGAFVQTYACQLFRPAFLPTYFTLNAPIRQTAVLPLASANQTALLAEAGGTTVPSDPQQDPGGGNPPTPHPPVVTPDPPHVWTDAECQAQNPYNVAKADGSGCIDKCLLYTTTTNPSNPSDPNTVQGCLTARKAAECSQKGGAWINGQCIPLYSRRGTRGLLRQIS